MRAVVLLAALLPTIALAYSQADCEAAQRSYSLEAGAFKSNPAAIDAAEARMRAACDRPERPAPTNIIVVPGGAPRDCTGPSDRNCIRR
jgi:hypothetical protein